jgi:hypothetical protein
MGLASEVQASTTTGLFVAHEIMKLNAFVFTPNARL